MPITVLDPRDSGVVQAAYSTVVAEPAIDPFFPDPATRPSFQYFPAVPSSAVSPLLPDPNVMLPGDNISSGSAWNAPWTWQVLPEGLMYKNYLAGLEEARIGSEVVHDKRLGWLWDASLGAHVGVLRYGTPDPIWPEGWQLDVDGVALARLDRNRNMVSTDFRVGFPIARREGPWEAKFGYYHLSSHLGDLYIENNPGAVRIPYVREQLVFGLAYRPIPDVRFYSEANWAFRNDGGSRPWEFQFGMDYSPTQPTGAYGAPFLALNTKLQQDLNYSGNFTAEGGWQWRGQTGHTLRAGVQYSNGMSFQRQFYDRYEQLIGGGMWYDF